MDHGPTDPSVIDMVNGVSDEPAPCTVSPLTGEQLLAYFGTVHPAPDQVLVQRVLRRLTHRLPGRRPGRTQPLATGRAAIQPPAGRGLTENACRAFWRRSAW
ncbi:hypothetical protein FHX75_1346 [Micromonospora palomenae]|uniref:Uncharacterized protein n=1 Tax=Micromonospora palomenae TaxID=1461247 RepID=A0A561VN31_9ACTN|nr:hypothetical protein FHX75_1346 [Micromonospora palomenae]